MTRGVWSDAGTLHFRSLVWHDKLEVVNLSHPSLDLMSHRLDVGSRCLLVLCFIYYFYFWYKKEKKGWCYSFGFLIPRCQCAWSFELYLWYDCLLYPCDLFLFYICSSWEWNTWFSLCLGCYSWLFNRSLKDKSYHVCMF